MSTSAISSSPQVIEAVTNHIKAKDVALYAAGGALVCTTCYLLFRNWQLSSQNEDVERALRVSFEAQIATTQGIEKILEEQSNKRETSVSNIGPWEVYTASAICVNTRSASPFSAANTATLATIHAHNLKAQEAISKVMPNYQPVLNEIDRDRQPSLAHEAIRGIVHGAASVAGQELAKGVQGVVDPTNYLRTLAAWGVSSALGYMRWGNKRGGTANDG